MSLQKFLSNWRNVVKIHPPKIPAQFPGLFQLFFSNQPHRLANETIEEKCGKFCFSNLIPVRWKQQNFSRIQFWRFYFPSFFLPKTHFAEKLKNCIRKFSDKKGEGNLRFSCNDKQFQSSSAFAAEILAEFFVCNENFMNFNCHSSCTEMPPQFLERFVNLALSTSETIQIKRYSNWIREKT